MPHTFFSSS